MKLFARVLIFIAVAAGSLSAGFVRHHWPYYSLPAVARPENPLHESLRPAGTVGLSAGILGTMLILLNLSYLLRKRLAHAPWVGSLRTWMGLHVLTGFASLVLILLHSAFLPRSALATIALGALMVVVLTGTIGRYIYGLVPRSVEGRELGIEEVRRQLSGHRAALGELGVDLKSLFGDRSLLAEDPGAGHGFAAIFLGDRGLKKRITELKASVLASGTSPETSRQIASLLHDLYRERVWLLRYDQLRSLMGSWRFLHRWLAILMVMLAMFHIGIALRFGELWIFRIFQ